mgnify:FL=1
MKTRYFSEYDNEIKAEKGLNEVINAINENVMSNGVRHAVMCEHQLIAEAQKNEKEFIINVIDSEVAKQLTNYTVFSLYYNTENLFDNKTVTISVKRTPVIKYFVEQEHNIYKIMLYPQNEKSIEDIIKVESEMLQRYETKATRIELKRPSSKIVLEKDIDGAFNITEIDYQSYSMDIKYFDTRRLETLESSSSTIGTVNLYCKVKNEVKTSAELYTMRSVSNEILRNIFRTASYQISKNIPEDRNKWTADTYIKAQNIRTEDVSYNWELDKACEMAKEFSKNPAREEMFKIHIDIDGYAGNISVNNGKINLYLTEQPKLRDFYKVLSKIITAFEIKNMYIQFGQYWKEKSEITVSQKEIFIEKHGIKKTDFPNLTELTKYGKRIVFEDTKDYKKYYFQNEEQLLDCEI